jgi:hypothetical protein
MIISCGVKYLAVSLKRFGVMRAATSGAGGQLARRVTIRRGCVFFRKGLEAQP